jgi:hypothetical protein
MDVPLGPLTDLGFCQPDETFITSLDDLHQWLAEMAACGEVVCLDGRPPGCNDPGHGPTRRCCTTPSGTPTPPRAWRCPLSTATCCGPTAAGRAAAMSTSWWRWQGWRGAGRGRGGKPVGSGVSGHGQRPRALVCAGRGPPHHRPAHQGQRAFNRVQAGLRALVEQAIAHLAGAWPLRRWRGLLHPVREVFRAAGALVCLGRWLHRVPARQRTPTPS